MYVHSSMVLSTFLSVWYGIVLTMNIPRRTAGSPSAGDDGALDPAARDRVHHHRARAVYYFIADFIGHRGIESIY